MFFSNKLQKYIFLTFMVLFLVVEIPIIAIGYNSKPMPSDTIIILGAKLIGRTPSTILRLRLDEALTLYKAGYATRIIVSGAQGKDEEISEAAGMQNYLINQGIPPENILLDENSFSTYQNLANSKIIMHEQGFKTAIIVSNSSHIRRSLVIAHNLGIQATGAPAPMSKNIYLTTTQYLREGAAMATLLFKDGE